MEYLHDFYGFLKLCADGTVLTLILILLITVAVVTAAF